MIKIINVTKKNYPDIIKLDAGDNGKHVASNSYTIIEALFNNKQDTLRAIKNHDRIIGLIYF